MESKIFEINSFLSSHSWCDFEIIELRGNLTIGGKTSFDDKYDIIIKFTDVFFIQCNYQWQSNTKNAVFEIPNQEESRRVNLQFSVEQGYHLFKIIPEDIETAFYISARNISYELL